MEVESFACAHKREMKDGALAARQSARHVHNGARFVPVISENRQEPVAVDVEPPGPAIHDHGDILNMLGL